MSAETPALSIPLLRHLATLAAIEIDGDEAADLVRELDAIVGYVEQLSAVPTDGVPPMTTVGTLAPGDRVPLRADEPHDGVTHDEALANAPQEEAAGFGVPAFLGNG